MQDPVIAGVCALSALLSNGGVSSVDVTQMYLDRITAYNPTLNAYITVTGDLALKQARQSDERRARGEILGPLDGVPIAIKDNIDVMGIATTAGMEVRRDRIASSDAGCIERLRKAGAVFLGKTNMHEAALGGITDNVAYGRCHNPHRHDWTPGGSSGGSGAAVVAGLCAAALGTDTLGSVRIPSSYCGCAGVKPTYGLVSQRGVVPLSWTLDHVGPMARSVTDLSLMMQCLAHFDPLDPYAVHAPSDFSLTAQTLSDLSGLTLGRVRTEDIVAVEPEILAARDEAIQILEQHGATIKSVALPPFDAQELRDTAVLILVAEGGTYHKDDLERHPKKFTEELRSRLSAGLTLDVADLENAYRTIAQMKVHIRQLFTQVDALILPATPHTAFPFERGSSNHQTDFTSLANYSGYPAVAVPNGMTSQGLPTSLMIMTPPFQDELALHIAQVFEKACSIDFWPDRFTPDGA